MNLDPLTHLLASIDPASVIVLIPFYFLIQIQWGVVY